MCDRSINSFDSQLMMQEYDLPGSWSRVVLQF